MNAVVFYDHCSAAVPYTGHMNISRREALGVVFDTFPPVLTVVVCDGEEEVAGVAVVIVVVVVVVIVVIVLVVAVDMIFVVVVVVVIVVVVVVVEDGPYSPSQEMTLTFNIDCHGFSFTHSNSYFQVVN